MKYIINGGKKLTGEVTVSGNKNAIFPCIAASLLTEDTVVLNNVSDIKDCEVLIKILEDLGASVKRDGSTLTINAAHINTSILPDELVTKLRGSIVLTGALLSRLKRVSFHFPGGDIIGQRSILTHIEGFKKLGAQIEEKDLKFTITLESIKHHGSNKNLTIFLDEASVTAAENLILVSVVSDASVILKNCPTEPHIQDLCHMLNTMGAKISGIGTNTLNIDGVEKLNGTTFRIGIDYIEIGTYIIASSVTGGRITIKGIDHTDLDPIVASLERFGINIKNDAGSVLVEPSELKAVKKIVTNIWPGIPTDLMSCIIVLATQSKGVTLCHDWMYESRMFFVDKIISMGAHISLADPHRVFVYGPTPLFGRVLETPDIRAGMALVIAALAAKGESIIKQAELIERGYEDVVGKLSLLGAKISRVE